VCTKVLELPRSKLVFVVGDNIIGYAELVHDLFDEFHSLNSYYGSCQLCFDPFVELIHRYEDVLASTFSFLEWTYQIQPPCKTGQVIGMVWS
jgi:hypothetical protein